MGQIDRESTFRGKILDHAVSLTKNEFPQFVARLCALEIYDEEEKVWVDWSEYAENEIMAYLVLFGGKGETLTCQQVKKVTGWDGTSFQGLNDMDLSETQIQFRVETNTYEEKTTLQVSWVDEYDAEPGRTVRKMDADELKQLDAKFKQILKASGKKAAPAKAPADKPKTPGKVTAKNVKPTSPKKPVTKAPPKAPPTAPPTLPEGKSTQQEAWDTVCELKEKNVSDNDIAKVWLDTIREVAPGKLQDDLTENDWFNVKEKVLSKTAIF